MLCQMNIVDLFTSDQARKNKAALKKQIKAEETELFMVHDNTTYFLNKAIGKLMKLLTMVTQNGAEKQTKS